MQNSFVSIIKPPGLTSSDVVVRARNILSRKLNRKVKAGHMGTLDPGAAGVLIVGFDKTNRLFDYLLKKNKTYIGRLQFGVSTDTLDSYGNIISSSTLPKKSDLDSILIEFIGEIDQIPPKYSALKINGRKAYELARKNIDVKIQARKTTIFNLEVLRYEEVNGNLNWVDLKVNCSFGTYIRTLFNDIAKKMNVDGYMSYLIRDSVHNVTINDSVTLEEFEQDPIKCLKDCKSLLENIMNFYELNDKEYKEIANGREIDLVTNDEFLALTYNSELKFIAKISNKKAKSVSNFE